MNITKCYKMITRFRRLKYNWDGYNASPVPDIVIINAIHFCHCLLEKQSVVLNRTDIYPSPYGTIVFSIHLKMNIVFIEIHTKSISFDILGYGIANIVLPENILINTDFNSIPKELDYVLDNY